MDRKTCRRIPCVSHLVSGIHIAAYTVFRTVQRYKFHSRSIVKYVYSRVKVSVHTARVCNKSDTLALETGKITLHKDLHSRFHHTARGIATSGHESDKYRYNYEQSSHISHLII